MGEVEARRNTAVQPACPVKLRFRACMEPPGVSRTAVPCFCLQRSLCTQPWAGTALAAVRAFLHAPAPGAGLGMPQVVVREGESEGVGP